MRNNSKLFRYLFVFIVGFLAGIYFFIFPCVNTSAAKGISKWICVTADSKGNCDGYFDTKDIKLISKSVYTVWCKFTGRRDKNEEINLGVKYDGLSAKDFNNFSYELVSYNINCQNRTYTSVTSIDYDIYGKVIKSIDSSAFPMYSSAPPGSIAHFFINFACDKK